MLKRTINSDRGLRRKARIDVFNNSLYHSNEKRIEKVINFSGIDKDAADFAPYDEQIRGSNQSIDRFR